MTSGGIDMRGLGAADWRTTVRADHPQLPDWFLAYGDDLAPQLAPLIDAHLGVAAAST